MNKYLVPLHIGIEVSAANADEAESNALEIVKTFLDPCYIDPSHTKSFLVEMKED